MRVIKMMFADKSNSETPVSDTTVHPGLIIRISSHLQHFAVNYWRLGVGL